MFMMRSPIGPDPMREMYSTEEEFRRARNNYTREQQVRNKQDKAFLAFVLVSLAFTMITFCAMIILMFGWLVFACVCAACVVFYGSVKVVEEWL